MLRLLSALFDQALIVIVVDIQALMFLVEKMKMIHNVLLKYRQWTSGRVKMESAADYDESFDLWWSYLPESLAL